MGRTAAWLDGALSLAWRVAVGWFYEWSTRDIAMVAIPVLMAMVLGANYVVLESSHSTFRHLATGSALLYAGFTLSALWVQGLLWLFGVQSRHIYTQAEFFEDIRFYVGWSLGIAIARNPVPGSPAA